MNNSPNQTWEQFAALWGPAVPMFAILVFYIHMLVFKKVPRGFRLIRKAMSFESARADARHKEALERLEKIEARIDSIPLCRQDRRHKTPAKK